MFAAYYNPVESKYLSEKCSQASNLSNDHNNNSNDNENKCPKVKFAPQNNNSSSHNHHHPSESYYNSCSIFNLVSKLSDIEQRRKKVEVESEQREKLRLKQEQIHKLCAEKEKSLREKAKKQSLLKQEQSCDALRRFYERKAKAAGIHCNNSSESINFQANSIQQQQQHHYHHQKQPFEQCHNKFNKFNKNNKVHLFNSSLFSSINSSITSSSSSSLSSSASSSATSIISYSGVSDSSSSSSSSSSSNNNFSHHHNNSNHNSNSIFNKHKNKNNRCRDLRQLVEKSRAALTINDFIIHHVRRQRTREVINKLGQLRQLELMLTLISESTVIDQDKRQEIKVQGILNQIDNIDSSNSEVICNKKNRIVKMAEGILMKSANLEDDFVLVEINECGEI